MKILRSISPTRRFCQKAPRPVVLVPTMGALHAGHASLVRKARKLAGRKGTVVVSIFVNPTQFGPSEDFARYPRAFAADRRICEQEGTDLIFAPEPGEMYAADHSTWVDEEKVSTLLCGASRPGHFRGVCTVVLKLFNVTGADAAVFGMKDYQQCTVIRRMVRDLNVPIRIEVADTVRESDGLAMSSRNTYLSGEERSQAPVIRTALTEARAAFQAGENSATKLRSRIVKQISKAPLARVDYVEISDGDTLLPVKKLTQGSVIAAAVFFGRTRLIDNIVL